MPLGDVLQLAQKPVNVRVDESYPSAGVLNRGRGLFDKGELAGSETSYNRLFRLSAGQVVYSKLFGWEGAVSLVPRDFDGYFVSSEFPTFDVASQVHARYLEQYLKSAAFTDQMARSTNGLGQRRQRVNIDAFLRIQVPLPASPDQERVASHLVQLEKRAIAPSFDPADLVDPSVSKWLETLPSASLLGVAEVCPRPVRVEPDTLVDFVPMGAVDATTGAISSPVPRTRGELSSGYRQFLPGDVIFARITPCMQNGKSAIYRGNFAQVGYGSTEFHVLRSRDDRYTEWLWALLRTDWFVTRAMTAFTGTAGQQRVPASFLERTTIPVPPISEVAADTRRLVGLRHRVNELTAALHRREHLASAILPAARNEIFSSMR